MKKLILSTLMGVLCAITFAQHSIDVVGNQCKHCNMTIKDPVFAAAAISEDGSHQFDAIECLVNFLKEQSESDFQTLLVADYGNEGSFVEASKATYLKSKAIASPMGAYISAYGSEEVARRVQKDKGGTLYNWKELKELFKDSRFGMLDHPTHQHNHPGAYAPIGVMGDHLHHKGGFMISLRYMGMYMDGNIQDRTEVTDMAIFQNYMVAPQRMKMTMYMLGVMYAPTDQLTVMIMQNFVRNDMDLQNMMGMEFVTKSSGVGDMRIGALYGLHASSTSSFHLNTSVNIPVGNVANRYSTPMVENMKLPYAMQLGSGTFDVSVGGTYKGSYNNWSWGAQPLFTIRTGENSQGYRFGNEWKIDGWLSNNLTRWVSVSGRVMSQTMGSIVGNDSELNAMMAPPANALNSGFTRVNAYLGTNVSFGDQSFWRNIKIGLEYGMPIFQKTTGIQMEARRITSAGIRYSI